MQVTAAFQATIRFANDRRRRYAEQASVCRRWGITRGHLTTAVALRATGAASRRREQRPYNWSATKIAIGATGATSRRRERRPNGQ